MALVALLTVPQPTVASSTSPKVRPLGDYPQKLLMEGLCRSDTLRTLVKKLQVSNLIVYVTVRPLKTGLSGGLQFVGASETGRIVRVVLNPSADRKQVITMLGHELQHAMEVAHEPEIADQQAFEAYYRLHRIRGEAEEARDTLEARNVEAMIRRELDHRASDGRWPTASTSCGR